jgi:hypothetical protein
MCLPHAEIGHLDWFSFLKYQICSIGRLRLCLYLALLLATTRLHNQVSASILGTTHSFIGNLLSPYRSVAKLVPIRCSISKGCGGFQKEFDEMKFPIQSVSVDLTYIRLQRRRFMSVETMTSNAKSAILYLFLFLQLVLG